MPWHGLIIVATPLSVFEEYIPRWGDRETTIPFDEVVEEGILFPFLSIQLVRVKDSNLRDRDG